MLRIFSCLVVMCGLLLGACPISIEPAESIVGTACKTSQDCALGTMCLTEPVDGYCTTACGNGVECPYGSTCILFDVLGIKAYTCMRSCSSAKDCGRSGYLCVTIPGNGETPVCTSSQQP